MKASKIRGAKRSRTTKKAQSPPGVAVSDDFLARFTELLRKHGGLIAVSEFTALSRPKQKARIASFFDEILAQERRKLEREMRILDGRIADAHVDSFRANLDALESHRSFLGSLIQYALEVRGDDSKSLEATITLIDEADALTREIDKARERAAAGVKALARAREVFAHGIAAACSRLLAKGLETGTPEDAIDRIAIELRKPVADVRAALSEHGVTLKLEGPVNGADFVIGALVDAHGRTVRRWRSETKSHIFDLWLEIQSDPDEDAPMTFGLPSEPADARASHTFALALGLAGTGENKP